ncbi:MAG: condensation domain-containing protein, partial [Pseudonocardiaceae bacterium]
MAVPVGSLDPGRLRAAVAWLGQRHPALRTTVHDGRQHVDDRRLELHMSLSSSGTQLDAARDWPGERFADGGPLARVALIGGAEEDFLVLASHQLVMDPWSWGLFLREVAARYAAPDNAGGPVLAYSDYARWQRRYLTGAVYAEHLAFWRAVAADHRAAVPAALAADLQAIGQRLEASLFQVLLALFHAAVAAWAGVRDVVVGSATANRTMPGTDQVVGFFVNGRFTRSQPRHATL